MELEQQAKFDRLVHQLERSAKRSTTNYYLKLILLTSLGYGYIAFLCVGIVGGLCFALWLLQLSQQRSISIDSRLLYAGVGLLAIAVFWVQYTPLQDRHLDRDEYPELFATIDRLQLQINTPPIHHVTINSEHNAGIYQAPRWGILGGYRNYLILGLPLMQSLSPAQFEATLAHELGHLSGNDSRFVGWIYRIRQMWEQLTIDNNLFFLQWFFRWYEPLIKAYSFVLVRDREYAADALAGNIAGKETAAADLIQTYVYQSYLQESFQRDLTAQMRDRSTPPPDLVTQMLASIRQPLDPQLARRWLGLALGETTDTVDTHPCLRDRLAAVGYLEPPDWMPACLPQTAAEYFFGDRSPNLLMDLDERWSNDNRSIWEKKHRYSRLQQEYLDLLTAKSHVVTLSLHEAIIRASLTQSAVDETAALPLWLDIINRDPERAIALYQAGKILASDRQQIGCDYLERAIALDPDLVICSCEEIYDFYLHQNNLELANIYLDWRQQHLPKQWRSKLERRVKDTDVFTHHNLPPDRLAELIDILTDRSAVSHAYLVCKQMQIFPDYPLYILAIDGKNLNSDPQTVDRLEIQLNLDERWNLIVNNPTNARLFYSIARLSNTRII
jgi:Zn-dependent protease with chaperone function